MTSRAADVLGIRGHRIAEGAPANFCIHDCDGVPDLLREHAAPRRVVSRGNIVAESAATTTFARSLPET